MISELDSNSLALKAKVAKFKELNEELKEEVTSKIELMEKMAEEPVKYGDDHPTLGLHLPGDDYGGKSE